MTFFFSHRQKGTLQGINISHLGKRKIIFKMPFFGDMLVSWRVCSLGFLSFPSFSSFEIHPFRLDSPGWMSWLGQLRHYEPSVSCVGRKLGWAQVKHLGKFAHSQQGSLSEWDVYPRFLCRISWKSTGGLDFWNHHFFHHARKEYHFQQFDWGEVIDIISDTVHKRDPAEETMRQSMTTVDTITVWGVNINPPGVSYGKINRKTCTKKKQHPKHISSERKTRTSRYELSLMRFPVFSRSKWKTTLAIVFLFGNVTTP